MEEFRDRVYGYEHMEFIMDFDLTDENANEINDDDFEF